VAPPALNECGGRLAPKIVERVLPSTVATAPALDPFLGLRCHSIVWPIIEGFDAIPAASTAVVGSASGTKRSLEYIQRLCIQTNSANHLACGQFSIPSAALERPVVGSLRVVAIPAAFIATVPEDRTLHRGCVLRGDIIGVWLDSTEWVMSRALYSINAGVACESKHSGCRRYIPG